MTCFGEQWMTHLPVCKPKRLCRYSTKTKLKQPSHLISSWFVGFLPSAKRRSWLPPVRGETEDLNSVKYEIINIHRGSGTLCNYANYFRCRKSQNHFYCISGDVAISLWTLAWPKNPGTFFFLALARKTQGHLRKDNKVAQRGFFLTPVCGWLIPWSGMSCHYAFDGRCSCCLHKPLWLTLSSRG